MNKPSVRGGLRVAVSQRINYFPARTEWQDSLDQRLVSWIKNLGALPIPVPNVLMPISALQAWLEAVAPRAIVLSGGNDIGENLGRDETEKSLLDYASTLELPVLGICRGMQMMAHHGGISLEPSPGHAGTRHALGSLNGAIFPEEVNSFHNWRIASCPKGYALTAEAEDGSIEAIRHQVLPWEGWMWHPEREEPFEETGMERARDLLGVTALK